MARFAVLVPLLALAAGCAGAPARADGTWPLEGADQLVLVTTGGWDAAQGRLRSFERSVNVP